jgi:Asp-tRNA(Asn)/Glu-tRNA(Gln) amidotransferase A subunit family amidase
MDHVTRLSANELARRIRSRELSPVAVTDGFLARIERVNPSINAIVTLSRHVIEDAKKAEAAVSRGDELGPLHGVPFTVKDTIETGGLRTTSGSAMRADYVPDRDAPAVALMKAAGAILLGKTNTAEMAMDYTADNPVFGRTVNPYDAGRTPGGSSGGEAAAIATCMSAFGLGSDLAGSIRIPAHFCGIVGMKPATGLVPGEGQFPPSAGPYSLGSVIGPLARTVADVRLVFDVLSHSKWHGRLARVGLTTGKMPVPLRNDLRMAWYTDDGISPVTRETKAAVESAASVLASSVSVVEERRPPGVEQALDTWLKLFSRASVVLLRDVYAGNEEKAGTFVKWRLSTADDAPPPSLDEYIQAWLMRDRLRAQLIEWMDGTILLAPVGAVPALEHDALKAFVDGQPISAFKAFSYCQAFNAFDLPSIVVPAGRSDSGLPIGVQIVGRPGDEDAIFSAAEVIEKALGGWQPPPSSKL